jgi:hypothetical protein
VANPVCAVLGRAEAMPQQRCRIATRRVFVEQIGYSNERSETGIAPDEIHWIP